MKAYVSVSDRILALTQDLDRIYHRIDHEKGVREACDLKNTHYRKLQSTLQREQRRQLLKLDDAFHTVRRACENAYFDVGFACGQLLAEKANRLSLRERKLADALRAQVLESGLPRRSILRILLAMSQGVAAGGEVFQSNARKRKPSAHHEA